MSQPEFDAELAETLTRLQSVKEWRAFAGMAIAMTKVWRGQLAKFNFEESTMEQIAKGRIKWTSMIHGVEMLFAQMNELTEELKRREKEEEEHAQRNPNTPDRIP